MYEQFDVIYSDKREIWNKIIKNFREWDIYYLNEYINLVEIYEHAKGILLYYKEEKVEIAIVLLVKDIAEDIRFKHVIPKNKYFDAETPYGYGGYLVNGVITDSILDKFKQNVYNWAKNQHIVSEFIRFSPFIKNKFIINGKIKYLHHTIYMDTTDENIVWKNLDPKNRNMIRKAEKNAVNIIVDNGENIEEFKRIYTQTMQRLNATDYYFFDDCYYEEMIKSLKKYIKLFYAVYQGKIIGASIFFYNDTNMHYHLSGCLTEFRHLGAMNLLIYKAALWAVEKNIRRLHLGGGITENDSLYGFKKQFNKNGVLDYFIGNNIYDDNIYNFLLDKRCEVDDTFDRNNNFLIQYRR